MIPAIERELSSPGILAVGASGEGVRRAQEWLQLAGLRVALDGHYGPKTADAVRAFQIAHHLPSTGVVDGATWEALSGPLRRAVAPVALPPGASLGAVVALYGWQFLAQSPRELDGPNSGPWVRAVMGGQSGESAPWCAGLDGVLMTLASAQLGVPLPFAPSVSSVRLARQAREAGRFLPGAEAAKRAGWPHEGTSALFVVPMGPGRVYRHTALAVGREGDRIVSLEGNTTSDGGREGKAMVRHEHRRVVDVDFLLLDL